VLMACARLSPGAHAAPAMGSLRIGSCGLANFKASSRGEQSDRSADGMGVCPEVVSGREKFEQTKSTVPLKMVSPAH